MSKILTIVGARPQFVKAAVVSRAIRAIPGLTEVLVHTGQHFDANMSDVFFDEMEIPAPDYHLGIASLAHGAMTGRMLEGIEEVVNKERPDALLVYGDTNSTLAGALAAKKMHIPVGHVEAGLRSFNIKMPEEVNRILTDRISDWLFCPTDTAVNNLHEEGFEQSKSIEGELFRVGDVMYDAVQYYLKKAPINPPSLAAAGLLEKEFVLATIHRQENTDDANNLRSIVAGLEAIHEHTAVVLPLHPRTRKKFEAEGITPSFHLIDPVGYFEMLALLKRCNLVVTDSGGLQKEAFFFGKFCVTAREQTEWVELVEGGYNRLVGADGKALTNAVNDLLKAEADFSVPLYGDGKAGEAIAKLLKERLTPQTAPAAGTT